jgi:glutamate carboxypeptidase
MDHDFVLLVNSQREDILTYLERLVRMESNSQEKAHVDRVIDILEKEYQALGMKTHRIYQENFGNHLVAETPQVEGPTVLLAGHADTVFPLGTIEKMPFYQDGEILYGPGVMDMKGGLTTMLFGVKTFLNTHKKLSGNIKIVINSDEEPGSPTSRPLWTELTKGIDWAFVFEWEPEKGALLMRRKGVGVFNFLVRGISAHAGEEPEKGASAFVSLANKIQRLNALNDFDIGTTVNVGVIKGGEQPYVIADTASAIIDVRVNNRDEQDSILKKLKKIAQSNDVPGTTCTFSGEFHRPPLEPQQSTEQLKLIIEDVGRNLGQKIHWTKAGAVSDANNIAAAGVPTIDGMGPYGGRAHSPDEFMSIPSLLKKTALLTGILSQLVG